MQAVFGFLGSIVAVVALAVAGSVFVVVMVALWQSGTLPMAWDVLKTFISGGWDALVAFWGLLRELVATF